MVVKKVAVVKKNAGDKTKSEGLNLFEVGTVQCTQMPVKQWTLMRRARLKILCDLN